MTRRSRGSGKEIKARRRKAEVPKRRNALIAASCTPSVTDLQARLDRQTHELIEARELQAATAEVLRVISISPNDTQPVFDTIAESAVRVCQGQLSFVARFDNELLRFGACHGLTPEGLEAFRRMLPRPAGEDTAAARAILRRAIVQIPDVLADRAFGPLDLAQKLNYRSIVAVPMLRDGNPIGVIAVARAQVGTFSAGQVALLETFARQAVIAVENVRLFNETKEALEQQTATADVLRVISSSPGDLEPVFGAMLQNAVRICDAQFGNLALLEGDGFRFVAHHGVPEKYRLEREREPFVRGTTSINRVIQTKQIVHVADVAAEEPQSGVVTLGGARTLLIVPMLKEDKLIGIIGIYRQEVRPFTDKQVELLQNFAAQAVIAIENARLLSELRQRTTDLTESLGQQTATAEVLKVISTSTGELQPVFRAILENAVQLCGAKFGTLYLRDGTGFRAAAMQNVPPAYAEQRAGVVHPSPAMDRMIQSRKPVHVADLRTDRSYLDGHPLLVTAVDAGGIRTYLGVPMLKADELVGVISIYRTEVRPFIGKQIELLTNFAAQAVIAIENARLLNELRDRTAELEKSYGLVRQQASQLEAQSQELLKLNKQLEQRVADQVGEIERMGRLRRFLPPQVADLIIASGTEKQLESHRREITALFCDLRGFTGFSESSDPEDVMALLRDYHAAIGQIIIKYGGTLERFAGDGVMVIFNDPVPVENPALQAVLMALDMRTAIGAMIEKWRDLGHDLGFGTGIAHGFATLGTIGFEGRFDYAAIGTVSNVASRLYDEAKPGQILISPRVRQAVDKAVTVEPIGEFTLKGIRRPMMTYNVLEPLSSNRT